MKIFHNNGCKNISFFIHQLENSEHEISESDKSYGFNLSDFDSYFGPVWRSHISTDWRLCD